MIKCFPALDVKLITNLQVASDYWANPPVGTSVHVGAAAYSNALVQQVHDLYLLTKF